MNWKNYCALFESMYDLSKQLFNDIEKKEHEYKSNCSKLFAFKNRKFVHPPISRNTLQVIWRALNLFAFRSLYYSRIIKITIPIWLLIDMKQSNKKWADPSKRTTY